MVGSRSLCPRDMGSKGAFTGEWALGRAQAWSYSLFYLLLSLLRVRLSVGACGLVLTH